MDYLVTGGMGFIGRHTIAALKVAHPGAGIVCLDNLSLSEETDLGVEFIKGDVRDQPLVNRLVGDCRRGIVHLAADSRVLPSLANPALVVDSAGSNVIGTANILAAIAKVDRKLGFVYAGSSTAYGNSSVPQKSGGTEAVLRPPDYLQSETDLPSVQSPYSATKLAGEMLVRSFVVTFGIQATVLRYFQVYGPGQPTTGAYALVTGIFLRQFAAGEPLTIEGDGSQSRDFVHVTDVARANVLALDKDSQGLPINIGSGETHTIKWLADYISLNQVHLPARKIDLKATHADIARAKNVLGWTPTIDIRKGIAQMIAVHNT
jgi:nucleoside-diphosphate-sugar epimerase